MMMAIACFFAFCLFSFDAGSQSQCGGTEQTVPEGSSEGSGVSGEQNNFDLQ